MAIGNIVCPGCGKEYLWQQQLAGHTVRCTCGRVMPVPPAPTQVDTDSVYALAPTEDAAPLSRNARAASNLDDSLFQLPCPACGQPIEFGGVVCTSCGYNVKTGEHTALRPAPAPNHQNYQHQQYSAPEPVAPPAPIPNVPQYAVPPSAPKHMEEESRRDVLVRYLGMIAVLLVLIGGVVVFKSLRPTKPPGTEQLSQDDAVIFEKLQGAAVMEAREWLEKDSQRMLGGYNTKQGIAKVEEMYRNGAVKVNCLGGRFVMSVVVELPTTPADRKRFFDWQKGHHEAIGETVTADIGQKYIYITLPR